MELFSLEDDDANDLFITQSSILDNNSSQNGGILGEPTDFSSPCASIVSGTSAKYSDISDDDFDDISCSQIQHKDMGNYKRSVNYISDK